MRALTTLIDQDTSDDGRPQVTTISTSIWAFTTLIWSIFTPPHFTFAARVILLQPLWILRVYVDDETWVQDLFVFLVLHAFYTLAVGAWSLPHITSLDDLRIDNETVWVYFQILSALAGCGILAAAIVVRGKQLAEDEAESTNAKTSSIEENAIPPLLIPSRTTHTRFVPKRHSFEYSYLFVGIPVGSVGKFGSALSVDCEKRGWFHVRGADYLTRSDSSKTLAQKLQAYLHTQGITSADYEFAYLVTAPRFLGYSFNPVSFWYVYDEDMTLKYMILEVNNTFDERRMYLLKPSKSETDEHEVTQTGRGKVFSQTWEKDFHVSPFNSRKGSYSLRAIDPLSASEKTGCAAFDNTITLRSSKDESKIVARVWSTQQPLTPTTITNPMLLRFVLSWWWVGLVTFPRIVWQAQKLFLSKKLIVYFRPEVTGYSIGRTFTSDERHLEAYFRAFISEAVEDSHQPLRLIYEPPHGEAEIVFYSPGFTYEEDHKTTLTLKIVSPAFYSRFIHYSHAKEAFDRECLATDEKNRTGTIEPAGLITVLLDAIKQQRKATIKTHRLSMEQYLWSLMTWLRCPPAEASYPAQSASQQLRIKDIRRFGPSELDSFVRTQCEDANVYVRIATKTFVAQRFTFGMPILITIFDWFVRAGMLCTAIIYIYNSEHFDVLRPRSHSKEDILPVITTLLLANSVHIWNFITAAE